MRLFHLTTAVGLALASAGALLWRIGSRQVPAEQLQSISADLVAPDAPKHPVTPQMIEETSHQVKVPAPRFERQDVSGDAVVIGGKRTKPQLVLFVKTDCPCSVDAQPIFNDLARHFGGRVEFVGVIDAGEEGARKWRGQNAMAFPLVADEDLSVIHAFKAKHSVYSALIARDGSIVKVWPGYSVEMLAEINKTIAAAAGEAVTPFDPTYAPSAKTSGCAFAQ